MARATLDIARHIVDAASNRQASDIVLLDLREVCNFTDYFVICSGESERQLEAICDEISETVSGDRISTRRYQGSTSSGWVILDLGDIVVHVFMPEQREYYALERVWDKAPKVVKIL